MNRPRPPGARPTEYRRPAWRPGRFAVSPPPWCDNEHPRPAYRTAEPSDSPPRASRYARTVAVRSSPATACREPSRADPAGPGRPRPRLCARLPYLPALRRSPHCGGRSTPSRAASLSRFAAAFADACPLDRAPGRPPLLASVAEQRFGTGRDYQLHSEPIVCPLAATADTKARITTGRRRLACERRVLIGDVIAPLNIPSNCAADASFPSPAPPLIFRTPTAGSPSAASSDDSYGPDADRWGASGQVEILSALTISEL